MMNRWPHVPVRRAAALTVALVVTALAVAAPAPVRAQTTQQEERDVVAVVEALFDAMRVRDGEAARALFHPEARLVSTGEREGRPAVRISGIEGFVGAIGEGGEPWDERIYDVEVRVDGNMASVWNGYDFFLGDEFSHCGVDAFHLVRTDDGWKILEIVDTRRREGCAAASGGSPDAR